MHLTTYSTLHSLNKAFRKEKVSKDDFILFKQELKKLISRINEDESEEHLKVPLRDFLKHTFYKDYEINTKGRTDLGIYLDNSDKDPIGVIIETKKPTNIADMITKDNINRKALHEAVLYYLRERIDCANNEIKNIIITNVYEWFIFDAHSFERLFYKSDLVKEYTKWKTGQKTSSNTDLFYKEIITPFLDSTDKEITCTHFDLRDYQSLLDSDNKETNKKLVALYKVFTDTNLLKKPFANDSNSLDRKFYNELLHIIGLEETKQGSKKLIGRKANPLNGSLIENAISTIETNEKLQKVKNTEKYGLTKDEQLFNIALELVITWINRILFLKLLEGQLIKYHNGKKEYKFLNSNIITDFDELNELFFEVLAKKENERKDYIKEKFRNIPYLNSSLFELKPGSLEDETILISNLKDRFKLPVYAQTVLRNNGKKLIGELSSLKYLFDFLDAFDFSSEGSDEIQEDNKSIINASVLGLIFEKINGYKEGSFFTPGFITMYMCHETIRRAVVQKFNDEKGWKCETIEQIKDKIEDRKEANRIINRIKICDPAVGSGHFLVSALNEIIAIKSELDVLCYRNGNRIKDYKIEVINDELIVTDKETEDIFEYRLNEKDKSIDYLQDIQETLFHEKQTIIENCLFGVDINPNSVNICRLRLWIELLKNAYYTKESGYTTLETLPNIDINIKCGNSLISRFPLDADLKQALKKSKWNIDTYRIAVQTYREAKNKSEKREMEKLIESIKNDFESEIARNDKRFLKLVKLKGELTNLTTQTSLFEKSKKEKDEWTKQVSEKTKEILKIETELDDIKNNVIYFNAFEWRFEFPEVLDDDGKFIGFDVVIGNPPYGINFNKKTGIIYSLLYKVFNWRGESYTLFVEKAVSLLKISGVFGFIIPDTILNLGFTEALRTYLLKNTAIREVDLLPSDVFNDATVDTILLFFQKTDITKSFVDVDIKINTYNKKDSIKTLDTSGRSFLIPSSLWHQQKSFNVQSNIHELNIINKVDSLFPLLNDFAEIFYGIKVYQIGKGKPAQTQEIRDKKPFTSNNQIGKEWLPFFDGKHIGYYSLLWKNDNWINYGPWLAEPRIPEKFENEKILIRKITGRTLIATYIPYSSYCNTLLFVLKLIPGKAMISYKALLGIINSGFIGWYFRRKFQINEEDTFPQIMIRDILQFAIPNTSNKTTNEIENKVSDILNMRESNKDTSHLEDEIDQLVYQLYGLTEEEIKIVEGTK